MINPCSHQLDRLRHHPRTGHDDTSSDVDAGIRADVDAGSTDTGQGAPGPDTTRAWEALEQAIIGKAIDLVSGPGGLASFLRRRQLGARLGGPSLPLDVGVSRDIPAAIRHAVIVRDRHCQWTGGCDQPASACEVHYGGRQFPATQVVVIRRTRPSGAGSSRNEGAPARANRRPTQSPGGEICHEGSPHPGPARTKRRPVTSVMLRSGSVALGQAPPPA